MTATLRTGSWEDDGDKGLVSYRSRSYVARAGMTTSNFLSMAMMQHK